MKTAFTAFKMVVLMTLLTGVAYPLLITLIAQVATPYTANGSLVVEKGGVVGSWLIAQKFTSPKYFWPRPSAGDYNPLASGGSNLGPTSATLKKLVDSRAQIFIKEGSTTHPQGVPLTLLFASGSGLDPHLNPKGAYFQVDRIIKARGWDRKMRPRIIELIDENMQWPFCGLIGTYCVNVLQLNRALDQLGDPQKER